MTMPNREGQSVPAVTFRTRQQGDWVDVHSDDIFANKTVIVFALPGAFTPTCSSSHLPRYNQLAPVFKANGVDEIVCLSVNDAFVMDAWGADQEAEHIRLLPDGNGDFSRGMEMLVDKQDLGFGQRSWRYSMLVKDGVIDQMFIEADVPGDPFDVSDADTMLNYINANAEVPAPASIFTKPGCPHCARAKALLQQRGMRYEEIVLGQHGISSQSLQAITGASSVPQVYIGAQHIGGADALQAHFSQQM